MYLNIVFFFAIKISLGTCCECDWNDYTSSCCHDFVPAYFIKNALQNKNNELIEKMNFYAIVRPILGLIFFDRNYY